MEPVPKQQYSTFEERIIIALLFVIYLAYEVMLFMRRCYYPHDPCVVHLDLFCLQSLVPKNAPMSGYPNPHIYTVMNCLSLEASSGSDFIFLLYC